MRSVVLACEGGTTGRDNDGLHFHGGLAAVGSAGSDGRGA